MTPWTVARQVPLCMGFSRQEYWSGLPFPPPGDLPHPGTVSPVAPTLQAHSLPLSHGKAPSGSQVTSQSKHVVREGTGPSLLAQVSPDAVWRQGGALLCLSLTHSPSNPMAGWEMPERHQTLSVWAAGQLAGA